MNGRRLVFAGCTAAAVAACSAGSVGGTSPPPAPSTAAPRRSATVSASAPATSVVAPPSPEEKLAAAIENARTCSEPKAHITNVPPENGTVFNNAQTDPDAGYIDRLDKIVKTIRDEPAYRCCFDAWQSEHPDGELKVMLRVTLDPQGSVKDAGIDPARSSAKDDVLVGCLAAVATNSSFPPSPTGKDTDVDYPFVVAARSATH